MSKRPDYFKPRVASDDGEHATSWRGAMSVGTQLGRGASVEMDACLYMINMRAYKGVELTGLEFQAKALSFV